MFFVKIKKIGDGGEKHSDGGMVLAIRFVSLDALNNGFRNDIMNYTLSMICTFFHLLAFFFSLNFCLNLKLKLKIDETKNHRKQQFENLEV